MGNDSGFVVIIFGALMLAGVGLYVLTKKKGPNPNDIVLDVGKDEQGRLQVVGTNLDMGNIAFNPSRPIFGTLFQEDRLGVPITGGSRRRGGVERFDEGALGTCQCDSDKCCYKTVYQPRRGDPETEKECVEVYYGDVVDACERAVQAAEHNTFRAVMAARTKKYMADAVRARMGRIYS